MVVEERRLRGVFTVLLEANSDGRGFFMRTYDRELFQKAGIDRDWVQENHSRSDRRHVIRGLHFQLPPFTETKLVRVIRGSILDVFVDLRKGSSTFGDWEAVELTEFEHRLLLVPRGFAHGFCTLSEESEVLYKVDSPYTPQSESGIRWNDAALKINWPTNRPLMSEKDRTLNYLKEFIVKYGSLEDD